MTVRTKIDGEDAIFKNGKWVYKSREMLDKKHMLCCDIGSYMCQVPMPLNGRRADIDFCIADLVAALNASNILTVASCCGHGEQDGTIMLEDGRTIIIKNVKGE